jgi:pilus assembly protein Flp/PilA
VGQTRQGNEAEMGRAWRAGGRALGCLAGRRCRIPRQKSLLFRGKLPAQAVEAQDPGDAREMMREIFPRFLADQDGATAVEYSLICGCIFLVIIAALVNFGAAATNMFNNLSNAVAGTP